MSRNHFVIVLAGKTGSGKSFLAKHLSGSDKFLVGNGIESMTEETQKHEFTLGNFTIEIWDTRGFNDNKRLSVKETLEQSLSLARSLQGGFNLILYCVEPKVRFDQSEVNGLVKLGILLGVDVFKHINIVVTQLDGLKDKLRPQLVQKYNDELPKLIKAKKIPFLSERPLLFSNFDNFEQFKDDLVSLLGSFQYYKPQIEEMDVENPLQNLSHPLLDEFFTRLEEKLVDSGDTGDQELETLKKMKALIETIRIISNQAGLTTKNMLDDLQKSSYQPFKLLADFNLEQDVKKPDTFVNNIYESKNSWGKYFNNLYDSRESEDIHHHLLKNDRYKVIMKEFKNSKPDMDLINSQYREALESSVQKPDKIMQPYNVIKYIFNILRRKDPVAVAVKNLQAEQLRNDEFRKIIINYLHDYFLTQYKDLTI